MRRLSSASVILLSFAGAILVGAFVLATPVASRGAPVAPLDALFTATSAVCVTGLTVVDTASRWTPFGQTVVLVLVQIGGLGILTFSTFAALLLGRRVSFAERDIVVSAVAPLRRVDVFHVVKRVIVTTLAIEAVGAFSLWLLWRRGLGNGAGAWHAVFHSVSAFCNAGFSTFGRNLLDWRADWGVNVVIMALVLLGGIGFIVFIDVENRVRYGRRFSLHSRVALATSGWLIVGGAAMFLLLEGSNTLRGAPWGEKALAAAFAAVTPRTAGFNTIDYGSVTATTLVVTIILMFIGGSPGSCAGGVKTTSAALLFAVARSAVRGRERADLFRRSVPEAAVRQAQTLILMAATLLVAAIVLLHVTEVGLVPFAHGHADSARLAFEAVSAFGTVGLSTGVTPDLSPWGKATLMLLMYVGRVGPLTVALFLARRRVSRYHYAVEGVLVG